MNVPTIGANFEISGYEAVQCTGDPMKDAKNFADANGISVEEAKKVLSGQFGDPKVQEGSNSNTGEKVAASKDDDAELVEDTEKTGDGNTTFTLDELKDTIKEIVTELLKNLGLTTTTNDDTTNNVITEVNNQLGVDNTDNTNTTNNTDNNTNNDEKITQADKDAINAGIDELKASHTEFKNRLNNWASSKGKYGLSELYQANLDFREKAIALCDLVSNLDTSGLDYSVRKDIDNAKDSVLTWTSRYKEAATYWANNSYKTKGDIWNNICVASDGMRNSGATLISKLEAAGL